MPKNPYAVSILHKGVVYPPDAEMPDELPSFPEKQEPPKLAVAASSTAEKSEPSSSNELDKKPSDKPKRPTKTIAVGA